MNAGENIKRIRKLRGITQEELGEMAGMSDSTIRSYEKGRNALKNEALVKMAEVLDVAPEALSGSNIVESATDLLQVFLLAEEEYGLEPIEGPDGMILGFDPKAKKSPKVEAALKAWKRKRDALESDEITQSEYEIWKAQFKA